MNGFLTPKEITLSSLLRNWTVFYLANFVGSVLLAWLLFKSGLYSGEAIATKAIGIAESKTAIPLWFPVFTTILICEQIKRLSMSLQNR